MQTKLNSISEIVKRDEKARLSSLAHLLSGENLKECFTMLKKGKAGGVDGLNVEDYAKDLESNLENLVGRMKAQAYHPQPVRRTYIEKANGKLRPLGIPAVDKGNERVAQGHKKYGGDCRHMEDAEVQAPRTFSLLWCKW